MISGRYALCKMATSAVRKLRLMCSRTRSRCYSYLPRTAKLALVAVRSLTKTPEGGHGGDLIMRTCEPIFSLFEKGVWWIGLLCFLIVIVGITTVSGTFYVYVVPAYWEGNMVFFSLWFVLGHYLLINVTFHYYKGFVTGPGSPKQVKNFSPYRDPTPSGWKVCFKCSQPKPPRSHHCRICNKCILKMDHHCPWFFNCIGQNNHRYFIMFVVYMWFAVMFVVLSLWKQMSFMYERSTPWLNSFMTSLGISQLEYYPKDHHIAVWEHFFTTIVFFVCFGVSIALAVLGGWHIYLITRAETSIEFYTNRNEAVDMRRAGKRFVNKYSYGKLNNWRIFLGLKSGRSLARHILLPSGHEPISDGMDWDVESEALRKITGFSSSSTSMLADMI